MNPSPTVQKIKYVGLDVHAETIAVAIADSSGAVRAYGIVPAHTHAVDKLVRKLAADGAEVRYVYEAGPTGFWLCRHLRGKGVSCEVIAPSLIPQKASDRVKTDRRDAAHLPDLLRHGRFPTIWLPDPAVQGANPRPDWPFLWLFGLLSLSPAGLETFLMLVFPALLVLGLFLVPFVSNRGERAPSRRPVAVLSVVVGVIFSALGINPSNIVESLQRLIRRLADLGFDTVQWAFGYFLLGAVVVSPIWFIVRLLRASKSSGPHS